MENKSFRRLPGLLAMLLVFALVAACAKTEAPASGTPAAPAADKPLPTIKVSAFNPPSQGAFLPPIISQKGLDKANGFVLQMAYKPSDTYQVDYASGQDQVGGSATFISETRRATQGVKTVMLFNMFDYFGGVITANPNIKTMKDLEGKSLGADTPTTVWGMGRWFLEKGGVDLSKVEILSQGQAAQIAAIHTGRVDAVWVPEPTYSLILVGEGGNKFHTIEADQKLWKQLTGLDTLPLLGVAAHQEWIDAHKELAQALYQAYKQAAEWAMKNPTEAAKIIAETTKLDAKAVEASLTAGRLGLNVQPTFATKNTIMAALEMAVKSKLVEKIPSADSFFYSGLK